jgi:hypothetical protein
LKLKRDEEVIKKRREIEDRAL